MRPAVLLVEPDDARRRALGEGLARYAYEVVPAVSADEGLRFAQGLGPAVIVASMDLPGFGDGHILERFTVRDRSMKRTLVLLGSGAEEAGDLPEDVLFLDVGELAADEVVRRVRLVLVGREVGLEPDAELGSLVGDLALLPMLELLRGLNRMMVGGMLRVADGGLMLDGGQVVSARVGAATGVKAVCRLGRRANGPFRLTLGSVTAVREIETDFFDLMISAIEEAQVPLPDLRARPRLQPAARLSGELNAQERALLEVVDRCATVGELLDALPVRDGRVIEALDRLVSLDVLRLNKPLAGVAVVTDSTGDLPKDLAREHDIRVVPLGIVFGDDVFRDGVDITPRDFYQLLESDEAHHPQTRPPPPAELHEHYASLLRYQDVLSIHISEALSQTVVHARTAAAGADLDAGAGHAIEVFDSRNVSMGLGLLALFASRLAQRGHGLRDIVTRLEAMAPRIELLFVVDSLDYLVRGGRLGRAQAAVGRLLGIKPILSVVGGEVKAVEKVRGGRRAHPRIVAMLAQRFDPAKPLVVTVAHARAPQWSDRLAKLLAERFTLAELIESDIGPVVGTHAGPGCVGCVAFQPTEEEWAAVRPLAAAAPAAAPAAATDATAATDA